MKITKLVKNNPQIIAPKNYLTFIAAENNSSITLNKIGTPSNIDVKFRKSTVGYWQSYTFGDTIQLTNINQYVQLKGYWTPANFTEQNYYQFSMSGKINSQGNLFTLYGNTKKLYSYNCYSLFANCSSLITPPELPVTKIQYCCYQSMFQNCIELNKVPSLPAIILSYGCYYKMFYNCQNITTVQNNLLPALNILTISYCEMFKNCINLQNMPNLPAISVSHRSYDSMFANCSNLHIISNISATIFNNSYCYQKMFENCTSLTIPPELPASTLNYRVL